MKIIPLGTAGFIPTSGKETISILLIEHKTAILFDAGTGVRRLAEARLQPHLQGIDELHVLFSHLHHDHTGGFTWLLRLWQGRIIVYLPTRPMVEFDGSLAMNLFTGLPFFALPLNNWPNVTGIKAIQQCEFQVNDLLVQTIPQVHAGGSLGFRVGEFALITDTEPREGHIDFLSGCDLVLMDTMHNLADFEALNVTEANPAQHGHSVGNARIAASAGIRRLGLIHIDPLYDSEGVQNVLKETEAGFAGAFIPEEGSIYHVND